VSRWPSFVWFLIAVGSLFAIAGVGSGWEPAAVIAGIVGVLAGAGLSLYVARRRGRRLPRSRSVSWLLPSIALFYAVAAATALAAGGGYEVVALAAALIPLAAGAMLLATTRTRTGGEAGTRRDDDARRRR